ncbi:MAG: translation initiation factor IF-2 [Myxococcota bacterium]|jgi:translation initiation factor IF-2
MSKKDLLDRIARSPADGAPPRRVEPVTADEDVVQKRVSRKVVRRRRAPASEDTAVAAAAPPKTIIRRRTVEAPEVPVVQAAEGTAAPEEALAAPVEAATPEPFATPEPVVEAAPAEKPAEVVAVAPETPAAPVVEASPVVAVAPVEAAVEPVAAPVAAAPVVAEKPAAAEAPVAAPEAKAAAAPTPAEPAKRSDERGRFAAMGLSPAVVALPPGYDPANPHAWRRRQATPAATNPAAPKTTVAAAAAPGTRRRRVDNRGSTGGPPPRGRVGAGGFSGGGRRKGRRKSSGPKAASPAPKGMKRKIRIDNVVSVAELAHAMGQKSSVVMKELIGLGQMVTVNDMLDIETAELVANEFEYTVENVGYQEDLLLQQVEEAEEEANLSSRPPVVTVMGHVDHGKTTLLDGIRKARVAQGEAGGITQHIGAYQVKTATGLITFIDTPGHQAFSAMRARGAQLTDIVVLVVAADDGVQPQTAEAIVHAKAAGVPIVVAINKMDKVGVNPDNIKTQLTEHGLVPEEWGGDTLFVPISALKGDGIDELLETLALQTEVMELRANSDRFAEGVVIEAKMQRGRGAVASVLVQKGTLKAGDFVVLGTTYGKVKAMFDHNGKKLKTAPPSTPVEIFGLSELPSTGDDFSVVKSEKNAKLLAETRATQRKREKMSRMHRKTAEDLYAAAQGGNKEVLNLVIKADVQGSLEALKGALDGIVIDGTEVRMLHTGVGDLTESDVNLAMASEALMVGFNIKMDAKARSLADQNGVEAEYYSVIYGVIDRVTALLTGMLAPEYELVRRGSAEVRTIFTISRIGTIAGSYVLDGKITRNNQGKVIRDGEVIYEGKITGLKRFKDDVREVTSGYECGISMDGFLDIKEGDVVEAYALEEIERV